MNRKPGLAVRVGWSWTARRRRRGASARPRSTASCDRHLGLQRRHGPGGDAGRDIGSAIATITVSDCSRSGVGDLLVLDPGTLGAPYPSYPGTAGALGALTGERVLVTDVATATTGLAQSGAGLLDGDRSADNALTTTGSGTLNAG